MESRARRKRRSAPRMRRASKSADAISCNDLMGRLNFTEYFFLLVTGREPDEQAALLPRPAAGRDRRARADADGAGRAHDLWRPIPTSLQAAVAAGILGCGTVVLGTSELCAQVADRSAPPRGGRRRPPTRRRARSPARYGRAGGKMPGFGHPIHHPVDPRAERILELADREGVSGVHVDLARRFRSAVAEAWGRPMPMNVSMPIAAVLLDLDFPAGDDQGRSRSSPAPPGCSRISPRSSRRPIGFLMAHHGEEAIAYRARRAAAGRRCSSPRSKRGPGPNSAKLDDTLYRKQVDYLFDHSRFYQKKLREAGFDTPPRSAGSTRSARCRFTEKDELRASRSERRSDRHASRRSARKGRAHFLDQRHDGQCRAIFR